jgi:haloalkane dehalogenase
MHIVESPVKRQIAVNGKTMSYVEMGQGDPIVFLHGNPTSSYLWRNVMPLVEQSGRCIAPDLIGMGDSDKLDKIGPDTYTFEIHRSFLDGFLDAIGANNKVTLVIHDWGSALGFDWANRHRESVKAIAYMEALVRPFVDWSDWHEGAASLFRSLRSDAGEHLILEKNLFIERILPGSIVRKLSEVEMDEYRRPFQNTNERWPTLSWPRSIPVAGNPSNTHKTIGEYAIWMAENELPKLFINAQPGAILTGSQRKFARSWKNQSEATVKGSHFIQEDSGPEIGQLVADWLSKIQPPSAIAGCGP